MAKNNHKVLTTTPGVCILEHHEKPSCVRNIVFIGIAATIILLILHYVADMVGFVTAAGGYDSPMEVLLSPMGLMVGVPGMAILLLLFAIIGLTHDIIRKRQLGNQAWLCIAVSEKLDAEDLTPILLDYHLKPLSGNDSNYQPRTEIPDGTYPWYAIPRKHSLPDNELDMEQQVLHSYITRVNRYHDDWNRRKNF